MTMFNFEPFEYVLIDVANMFGNDKDTFQDRIKWTVENIKNLEHLTSKVKPKEVPYYVASVQSLRRIQAGKSTGYPVALDACSSGIQLLSVLSGCLTGAGNTGLIDPFTRSDIYTHTTNRMGEVLERAMKHERSDVKKALMTKFYGSKAIPQKVFGKGTIALKTFYDVANEVAPGATILADELEHAWTEEEVHEVDYADGFHFRTPVLCSKDAEVEIDELDHHRFRYRYETTEAVSKGIKHISNVTQGFDGLVVREIKRQCSYNREDILTAMRILDGSQRTFQTGTKRIDNTQQYRLVQLASEHGYTSIRLIENLTPDNVSVIPSHMRDTLYERLFRCFQHKAFPVNTVHDAFHALPDCMQFVRETYNRILADLATSSSMDYIISALSGTPFVMNKMDKNEGKTLANFILNSNYGIS